MTFEIPYTKRPEDVNKLLQILPAAKMPADKVDAIYLKSLGFSDSSSKHLFDILKMLGFIDDNDKPSAIWLAYVADEKRGLILASAIKKAYPDLFKFILCPYLEDDQVILDFFGVRNPDVSAGYCSKFIADALNSILDC